MKSYKNNLNDYQCIYTIGLCFVFNQIKCKQQTIMMYHIFIIGTYSPGVPRSYSDMLSCMLNSTFEPSLDLGSGGGGGHSFLQIYTNFVPNWLNIIDWHSQLNIFIMAINTKDHVSFLLQKYQLYGYIFYPTSPQKIPYHL